MCVYDDDEEFFQVRSGPSKDPSDQAKFIRIALT